MLFSHALIITVNESSENDDVNNGSAYVITQKCINPRDQISLFGSSFASVFVGVMYVLYFGIGLTAVFGNILVITAVFKFTWLQVTTNFLVASLAASDLLIGICIVSDCILYHFNMCAFHYEECIITTCVQTIANIASNVNLLQASYDRHLYITSPLHYNTTSRKRRLRITIPLVWVYSLILGVVPLAPSLASNRDSYKTCIIYKLYPPAFLIALISINCYALYAVVFGFYVHIWRIATRHKRKITKVMCKNGGVEASAPKMNWKSTKLLAMITVSLFILNVPYTVVLIYLVLCGNCKVNFLVVLFIYVAFYSATCANFIIYVWYSKDFKMAFKIILLSFIGKTNPDAKHKRPHEAPHIKQTFKTDRHLDCVSPPPRRKFAVAGLEFNRHLPKAAISYIHGNRNISPHKIETVAHVYDNQCLDLTEDQPDSKTDDRKGNFGDGKDIHSNGKSVIESVHSNDLDRSGDGKIELENQVSDLNQATLMTSDDDSSHSDTGDAVYTILRATDHITRLHHLENIIRARSVKHNHKGPKEERNPGQKKSRSLKYPPKHEPVIHALVVLKGTHSLPIGPIGDSRQMSEDSATDNIKANQTSTPIQEDGDDQNDEQVKVIKPVSLSPIMVHNAIQTDSKYSDNSAQDKDHTQCQSSDEYSDGVEMEIEKNGNTTGESLRIGSNTKTTSSAFDTIHLSVEAQTNTSCTLPNQELQCAELYANQRDSAFVKPHQNLCRINATQQSLSQLVESKPAKYFDINRKQQRSYEKGYDKKKQQCLSDVRRQSLPEVKGIDTVESYFNKITKVDSGFEEFDQLGQNDLGQSEVALHKELVYKILRRRKTTPENVIKTAISQQCNNGKNQEIKSGLQPELNAKFLLNTTHSLKLTVIPNIQSNHV